MPVEGTQYTKQALTPIPIGVLAQTSSTLADPRTILRPLILRIGDIDNPTFLREASPTGERFEQVITLMAQLMQQYRLHWVTVGDSPGQFAWLIERSTPDVSAQVDELFQLLDLARPPSDASTIYVPVIPALQRDPAGGINIQTRSVYQLVEILSAAVELPEEDVANGVVAEKPPLGPLASSLRIKHVNSQPQFAATAINYRDNWFYIDDRDVTTKQYFRVLSVMWSGVIADAKGPTAGRPVLTVPASR